ncbi:MAG: hypothetical protein ACFFCD_04840 [Promethearchaeota archaeon]
MNEVQKKIYRNITCPECKSTFNLLYARAVACGGCPNAVSGCMYVRCPKCDYDFPLTSNLTSSKMESKMVSRYMSKRLADYMEQF